MRKLDGYPVERSIIVLAVLLIGFAFAILLFVWLS